MRVTSKGQVTIPQEIREKLGITPHCEVDFVLEDRKVFIRKRADASDARLRLDRIRGTATVRMTTEEILRLTRGD